MLLLKRPHRNGGAGRPAIKNLSRPRRYRDRRPSSSSRRIATKDRPGIGGVRRVPRATGDRGVGRAAPSGSAAAAVRWNDADVEGRRPAVAREDARREAALDRLGIVVFGSTTTVGTAERRRRQRRKDDDREPCIGPRRKNDGTTTSSSFLAGAVGQGRRIGLDGRRGKVEARVLRQICWRRMRRRGRRRLRGMEAVPEPVWDDRCEGREGGRRRRRR
mmetsp:Transcript_18252/g.43928  ORF Transcript_18252/g.43928 Transcript_18252/m.43928 type:complete len:218 (+) Transcript_18252:801-1454(+)